MYRQNSNAPPQGARRFARKNLPPPGLTNGAECVYFVTGHKNRGAEGHPRLRSKQTAASGHLEPDPDNAGVGSLTHIPVILRLRLLVLAGAFLVFMYFLLFGEDIHP